MSREIQTEKAKPFRLVKYFTFSSLIVIFFGTLILSMLNTHWARTMLLKQSEDYAILLAENLNHQILSQFIIPVALKYGKIQLRNVEQFERMDKVVHRTLHGFKVEMVNMYDMNHIVSYSFDKSRVGKKFVRSTEYEKAIKGQVTSKLIQVGSFWEIFIGLPKSIKIVTFAPVQAEFPMSGLSSPVLGVMEIVQDLSHDYKGIFQFQMRLIFTCTVVMGILFLVLLYVVRRGELIIHKRNQERLQLKEQLARAERLSSIGEMVAGISHEIRNPLGIIQSSAELLKKQMARHDPKNTIPNIIVEEAGRLNRIIKDFLDFARPRDPNLVPCQVSDLLNKSVTYFSQSLNGHYRIQCHYEASSLPEVMMDESMMHQAFLNILINAVQAMPEGGDIEVSILSEADKLIVRIQDNGPGISPDIVEKIWDPFFTTKETGTGLGLGIVKNIVDAHGGRIFIENINPRGTRVSLEFPLPLQ